MAKAVLLAIFTLCFTRVPHIAATASKPLTCNLGEITTNSISDVGIFLVKCPIGTTLPPLAGRASSDEGQVFLRPNNEHDIVPIRDLIPGARFGQEQAAPIVHILQLPMAPRTFYLSCTKGGESIGTSGPKKDDCVIAVQVAASTRLGPNSCSVGGSRIPFAIERNNETANFSCGEGRILRPAEFAKKAFAEDCSNEVALPDKVKVTQVAEQAQQYQVTTPELPKRKTTICYVCEKKDSGNASDKCQVVISIAGSSACGALAVGVAARAAAAVGLTVAALRAW